MPQTPRGLDGHGSPMPSPFVSKPSPGVVYSRIGSREMRGFECFVGVALAALSLFVLVAGLMGREGVLRIGKKAAGEPTEEPKTPYRRIVVSNVVLGIIGVVVGIIMVVFTCFV